MPSDEYAPIVRGGLKLKGSKPTGVEKKKKKKKATAPESSSTKQEALAEGEEQLDEEKLKELDPRDNNGKTASERAYEEMRRKRVRSLFLFLLFLLSFFFPLFTFLGPNC
jgi:protein FAM32A